MLLLTYVIQEMLQDLWEVGGKEICKEKPLLYLYAPTAHMYGCREKGYKSNNSYHLLETWHICIL